MVTLLIFLMARLNNLWVVLGTGSSPFAWNPYISRGR